MTIKGYKKLTWVLGALLLLAVLGGGSTMLHFAKQEIRIMLAEEQTRIFAACRDEALQSGTENAIDNLQYEWRYYPSGSKQEIGSRLDRVVERARLGVAREIIAHLRMKTGKDYGDNPEAWLKAYGKD
jgi:hypothetical protein